MIFLYPKVELNTTNMRIKTGGNIESNETASIERDKTIGDFFATTP